ncbi:MAG TPA: Ldh family oxidoreductase [Kaistia sp.]|nr:Ldh family oxidoreductase [Kaistia sp.]
MKISEPSAMALATRLLIQRNALIGHAECQARVLVEAELKGHPSHGLQRLPRIIARIERGLIDPRTKGEGFWRAEAVWDVDGRNGLGPVVAMTALERLAERVATAGIAVATIRNNNHLGMLAHYVEHIAERGHVGVAMSSSEALVHPFGGTRAMLGTNPIAIAVPTAGRPLVLDLATSTVSMGKIHHYAATGRPMPEGWARDAEGNPTTDAERAKSGSIAPFGDAKGYGLGIAIEVLIAALAGSALAPDIRGTLDAEALCNKGDILIVVNPKAAPQLAERLSDYLDSVRTSPPAEAGRPVAIPGDGASLRRAAALRGGFDIEPTLWDALNALSLSPSSVLEGQSF